MPITDHVPVKLSVAEKNHYTWKTYFYLLFREYNLRNHVDGSVDLLDHRDPDWLAIDATIIRWLFLTISPDIFKTVVREGDDARTVWIKINRLFTDNKLQRIIFLQQEFFGTPQHDQTLDAYCLRLKAISDELQDLGFQVGDALLLSTLTAGLNEPHPHGRAYLRAHRRLSSPRGTSFEEPPLPRRPHPLCCRVPRSGPVGPRDLPAATASPGAHGALSRLPAAAATAAATAQRRLIRLQRIYNF
jgi:hypothetical protein